VPKPTTFRRRRDLVYGIALRKVLLAERRNPEEAHELKRRRLVDGTYPLPADIENRLTGNRL